MSRDCSDPITQAADILGWDNDAMGPLHSYRPSSTWADADKYPTKVFSPAKRSTMCYATIGGAQSQAGTTSGNSGRNWSAQLSSRAGQ